MKASIRQRLEKLSDRFEEVGRLLATDEVAGGSQRFRELSVEYARLAPLAERYRAYRGLERDLKAAADMEGDVDAGMRALGAEELARVKGEIGAAEEELRLLLLPKDPRDDKNIFLEVRAGTGGDEAAIFAGDLHRMYARYAESKGLAVEVLSESPGEHGGYKEIISRIAGKGAFSLLKFESGTHRVQRVPATEAQGRIHTSTVTVAILPEPDELSEIELKPADLRVDTYRSSGAGGQHVNKTDSAVRITHLPTNIVVTCQNERSQHRNRDVAMSILKAKLADRAREQAEAKMAQEVGDKKKIEWGSQIRSYVFHPYNLVKDHRTNIETSNVQAVMDGALDEFIRGYLLSGGAG
ncbi:MAG TPA: peptide chain release factor 1, partial [Steroidobacteraceae bacterium]|nr:peptide chain release factor 1 [Steroidobacteraceae bacterium]